MKAKKINEGLDFERGLDPKKSMNIGKRRITAKIGHTGDGSCIYISVGNQSEIYYLVEEDDDSNVLWDKIEKIASSMGAKYIYDYESEPQRWEIGKFPITEALDFERGQDPKRAMNLGIFYKKWREDHDQKPLIIYRFFLKDPMGNKKIYTVTLMYKIKNGNHIGDTIYFTNERLLSSEGTMFSLGNMQSKPDHMFDPAETTFWSKPESFDKEIDHIVKSPKDWFNNMCEEWFEQPFETMMRSWFRSGVMRVEKAEFQFKG